MIDVWLRTLALPRFQKVIPIKFLVVYMFLVVYIFFTSLDEISHVHDQNLNILYMFAKLQ